MAKNVYTVAQVNQYIKNMFVQDFLLAKLYVKGEVSNCKYHSSGHIYFSLKDETGTIACIMFASDRRNLAFRMTDGQKVIALGSVRVFERDGKYQLYVKELLPDGEGDLYRRFEKLKATLLEMGMFDAQFKKPIPMYAKRIGIVTASTGAAIRDIINIAHRRNPYVQLFLYPAIVQGDQAADSIVKGIETLDRYGVDVLIVGRGGGSIEDLWAFIEEKVARAIFACQTPVISAVGHETDTTIADYVADLRAPTPSAAAELAVADYKQLMDAFTLFRCQLTDRMEQRLRQQQIKLEDMSLLLEKYGPFERLATHKWQLTSKKDALEHAMAKKVDERRHLIELYAGKLDGLSPLKRLSQGYSYTKTDAGEALRSVDQVKKGESLWIQVVDGTVETRVEHILRKG